MLAMYTTADAYHGLVIEHESLLALHGIDG
jgi:hypothetical protein